MTGGGVSDAVHAYHDGTKHYFHRFARSLGYLDWASQPSPFRSFGETELVPLPPRPDSTVTSTPGQSPTTIGQVLRHALGLSAWKQLRGSQGSARWALRVNPSSGNLHPTEAYIVARGDSGFLAGAGVYHYAPDRHVLERRCTFDPAAWPAIDADSWLVALTSIHWREAWKYGERAFRYCQHDLGHAIAAIRIAAATVGCDAAVLPDWSHDDMAAMTGIDRDEDFFEAEREEPGCVMLVARAPVNVDRSTLIAAARGGVWTGRASQLSEDHVTWSFIDQIAATTRDPGRHATPRLALDAPPAPSTRPAPAAPPTPPAPPTRPAPPARPTPPAPYSPELILRRRSAVAFDGQTTMEAAAFLAMLSRVMPEQAMPWDVLWWPARVHLALFVHRVRGVESGLYLLARDPTALDRLRSSCAREWLWERAGRQLPLFLLARGDFRDTARRVSCDQQIAADGFFSVGMLAEFDASLQMFGPSFYRQLFWETGVVGQVLYLEAEAAGARATGIGCFFDDAVHELLGIADHSFQSLYHFTVGMPVEDSRLTTEPGYEWELGAKAKS
jgi:SagB-type dehydrogenase family enzyme